MTGRLPGKKSIKTKLMTLLVVGNSLLLLAVTLCFISYQLAGGSAHSSMMLFSTLLLLFTAIGMTGLCWLLSCRIKQLIADPLAHLTKKMEIVSRSQDYMVRVRRWSDDELGLLFECFNDMLAEISIRDERLALHSEELELDVADRTRELSHVNRQLAESLEEVRRAMQEAQSASRAKSEFLAQMSHEIRTPMYGVLGMTELLQNSQLTKKQSRYLERIRQSGEALLAIIINDILDFSKIEAGKMELEAIPFDLPELVADTVEMFSEEAGKKRLKLTFAISGEVPRSFKGDPGRLRQVIVNLIGNSVKFTPDGSITVTVQMERAPNLLRVSISDTGIGITPEEQARIFNKFSQGDQSMTRRYGGTGLGLAIVRQLTELMGGELRVTSKPGFGSTFSFTASLEALREHEWVQPERRSMALLRGKSVLIASDAPEVRATLLDELAALGMEVKCVADAADAIGKLLAAPVDLAIVDQRLARTDGIELAATIRTLPAGRWVRLMLLTDEDFSEQSERARQIGAFIFFKKTLRLHGLYWALLRALGIEQPLVENDGDCVNQLTRAPKVLLVEDNPVNQEISQALLESLGCSVELVDNGRSAVEAVRRRQFDLVFMDCEMPGMDGLEATRRIRGWEESQRSASSGPVISRIPVIALTAYAMKKDRTACLAAGADDYLSKPFTCEELSRLISRHLRATTDEAASVQSRDAVAPRPDEVISLDKMAGALEMIRQLPGNRGLEILRKVVDFYLESTPTLLQTMRDAESGGDAEKLKTAAHSFKSSSANLGAMRLAGVCLELETLGRAGSTEGALPLLVKVEEEYRLVRDVLQGGTLC